MVNKGEQTMPGNQNSLAKAYLQALDINGKETGSRIPVMFNPAEYALSRSNNYQKTRIPGLTTPSTQFVSGSGESFTVELFFDTYEAGSDVRDHTRQVVSLMEIESDTHTPPVCQFVWGSVVFKGIVEEIKQKFTMFLDSGVPVRAVLNLRMSEYKNPSQQWQETPRNSADRTKRRMVVQGDSLWMIAAREYGDPGLWRPIAEANQIDNPRCLEPGRELIVPPLEQ